MKTLRYFLLFSTLVAFMLSGCESLDVKNENDPDFETAFANPADVKGVAGSLINSWFILTQNESSPLLMFAVGADAATCSWGNFAMRDFSYEPRIAWDNTPAYPNAEYSENFYNTLYSILSSANEVLGKVELGGMMIVGEDGSDEAKMVQAVAHLAQGLSLGYVGLVYDKAYIVTEYTDLTKTVVQSNYKSVIDTAVASLDKCIAICSNNTFTLPSDWIPGLVMTNSKLGELANTVAAALLSYSPRNKSDNDAVNWSKVKGYADLGLSYDFAPVMDDISWYAYGDYYGNTSGWAQTDMRLVNMMDPRFPSRWVDAATWNILPAPATSHTAGIDDRIFTDFQFLNTCGFRVERGYYHFSCYRFKKFDTYLTTWVEPVPVFTKVENDLLKAEALVHQSNPTSAAAIINSGTRVTRGALAPVSTSADAVNAAIFYERNIELYSTGFGIEFFTMRKADKLQSGTPLHLPIPGQQLEVNIMEYYTFGPDNGVSGQDYSSGGWF